MLEALGTVKSLGVEDGDRLHVRGLASSLLVVKDAVPPVPEPADGLLGRVPARGMTLGYKMSEMKKEDVLLMGSPYRFGLNTAAELTAAAAAAADEASMPVNQKVAAAG